MYCPGRELGEAPAAPQLRLMLSRSCCCCACMHARLSDFPNKILESSHASVDPTQRGPLHQYFSVLPISHPQQHEESDGTHPIPQLSMSPAAQTEELTQ